jgi:hypothetical protein
MAVLRLFDEYGERTEKAGITAVPAMAFYGGLADLLATAAMGDWQHADEILIAIALDSWHPTRGTRLTGERNTFERVVVSGGKLVAAADTPARAWDFPAPFGKQDVVAVPLSEIITISRHLRASEVQSFMNEAPLKDLGRADTPSPQAVDESGRSAQTFLVDVIVRNAGKTRRAIAHGRDIYAVTGPLAVEAIERIVRASPPRGGVFAPGAIFEPMSFLNALSPTHLTVEIAGRANRTLA